MMNKKVSTLLVSALLVLFACNVSGKEPSAAGSFYPSDKKELKGMVETFLSKAQKVPDSGRLIAIISPHAGYRYSGQVAAYGYKEIKGRDIRRVILIGPSHYVEFKGASIYTKGKFRTPLGDVKIDERAAESLLDEKADLKFYPDAFEKEHSLEVQLPFLQTVLKDFTIVPIVVGSPTQKLADLLDEKTLLVASSDLSHYHDYDRAKGMDSKIISAVERLSVVDARNLLQAGESEMCGAYPVIITMEAARRAGADLGVLLNYANSGDVTGDKTTVVGYSSIGLFEAPYTKKERKELLGLARKTIRTYVTTGKAPEVDIKNPKFKSDGAVFVTITEKGALRGCIGNIQPVMPLYQSVIKNAVAACSADPRFPRMTKDELKDMEVEISVLSPLKPLKDVRDIQVGKHGLVIRKDGRSGIFLPQVATEFGWNRETFLEKLCTKAGLPEGSWKDADLYTFTAEIIK
jgi:hypothetical protein